MLNQVVVIGRIYNDLELKDGKLEIILAVPKREKNEEGIYETDYIPIVLEGGVAEKTIKYCNKGDLVGAKGIISSVTMASGYDIHIVAERITFLSSTHPDKEEV